MAYTLRWTGPTQNTDGSAFDQSQFAGYELDLDGQPAVAVPVGYDTDNQYEFDLRSLSGFSFGTHTARVRVVNRLGNRSDFSNQVSFTHADERVPNPPLSLVAV